ncbi:MAG: diguanylate cyclase [Pseudomonadota bacterium]
MAASVLVVAPNPLQRTAWRAHLSAAYHVVSEAGSLAEAAMLARDAVPDVVLASSDLVVDDDPVDLHTLRQTALTSEAALLIVTPTIAGAVEAGFSAGCDDVLIDPVTPTALRTRVRRAHRDKKVLDSLDLCTSAFCADRLPLTREDLPSIVRVCPTNAPCCNLAGLTVERCLTKPDPHHLVEVVAASDPDVVVIEHMPSAGLDAHVYLALLDATAVTRNIARFVVMADQSEHDASLALDLGAHELVMPPFLPGEVASRIRALARRRARFDHMRRQLHSKLRLASIDALTGLSNRRHLASEVPRLLREARHRGAMSALFMLDIDHFKNVNDRHGHLAGDVALIEVARRLRAMAGPRDFLARFGGEEFLLLRTSTTSQDVGALAERLRSSVEGRPIALPCGHTIKLTASLGVAIAPASGDCTLDQLVRSADRALYTCKAAGRNCVRIREVAA